jgi:hypothetical protein
MEEGFYILEAVGLKAYLEPCLTMMEANRLSTSCETLGNDKKTKEVWAAIFRHLQDEGKEVEFVEEGNKEFSKEEDQGLCCFATTLKTPRGRGGLNPLNSPKHLHLQEAADDTLSISFVGSALGPRITSLKHALALVKGELGSRAPDAPYAMVHGGIKGMWDELGDLKAYLGNYSTALDSKAKGSRVDKLLAKTLAAWSKGNEALRVVEQLVNHGPDSQGTRLELELRDMAQWMRDLEETIDKASKFVVELSSYLLNMPTAPGGTSSGLVPQAEFLALGGPQVRFPPVFSESKKTNGLKFHVTRCFESRESKSLVTSPPLLPPHNGAPPSPPVCTQDPLPCEGIN